MIPNLPLALPIVFILTTVVTIWLFIRTTQSIPVAIGVIAWLLLTGVLAVNGVYSNNLQAVPPKLFILGLVPPMLVILIAFLSGGGRKFIDKLSLQRVTWTNIVRIPVEIGLFMLSLNGAVPKLMTFEGGNLDILSGITAPIMALLVFSKAGAFKNGASHKWLLAWNIICLALLINIVTRALLSAPLPFQKLAFEQPNIAILHFPFIWLPTFIVPVVLFGHLVSIRQLIKGTAKPGAAKP